METRSTRSFNAIHASITRCVLSCIYQSCYVNHIVGVLFTYFFSFNHCKYFKFVANFYLLSYLLRKIDDVA